MRKVRDQGPRLFVGALGVCICIAAGWKLWCAIQHAMADGTVPLSDTKPMAHGARYAYAWKDAWGYFAGWLFVLAGGVMVCTSVTRRWWLLVVAVPVFWFGFIFVSAAPMLGTVSGVLLLLCVILGGSLVAAGLGMWHGEWRHRQLDIEPEIQDLKNERARYLRRHIVRRPVSDQADAHARDQDRQAAN